MWPSQNIWTLPQVDLFSFVFWKKLKTPKRHYKLTFSNHLWNSLTEITLQWVYIKQRETERESTYLHTSYSKKTAQCAMEPNKVFQIEFESYLLWQHLTGWQLFESRFCLPFYRINSLNGHSNVFQFLDLNATKNVEL